MKSPDPKLKKLEEAIFMIVINSNPKRSPDGQLREIMQIVTQVPCCGHNCCCLKEKEMERELG